MINVHRNLNQNRKSCLVHQNRYLLENVSDVDLPGPTKINHALLKDSNATIAKSTITLHVFAGRLDENNPAMKSVRLNRLNNK